MRATRLPVALAAFAAACLAVPAPALAVPGAPTGLTAPTPTRLKPVLTWTAPGGTISGYNVYRGATRVNVGLVSGTTFTDNGLATQGSVTYTVTALDGAGEGPASAGFTVLYDTTAPTAPAGLTGVTPTAAKPALSWNPATDTLSGVASYELYRGTTLVGTTATLALSDLALSSTGSQTYTVKAVDAAGNVSAASAARAIVYDNLAPGAPVVSAPAATNVAPVLTWPAPTDAGGSGIARYEVYRGPTLLTSVTTLTFTDTGVPGQGSYTYTVRTVDNAGNVSLASAPKTVLYDSTPPGAAGAPATPAAITNAKPVVTFTAATDNAGGSGLVRYDVYRGATLAGSTTTTTFTDTGLALSGINAYSVRAVDAAGSQGPANGTVTITYDSLAPSVPAGLTGATPTSAKPALTWTASTDNLSGVVRYDVFRGAALIGSTAGTSFTDTALTATGSQAYTVKAVDAAGSSSAASAVKSIVYDNASPTPPALTAPAATNAAPVLAWSGATDAGGSNIVRYEILRDGVQIGTATGAGYTDTSLPGQGDYDYAVRTVDGAGNVSTLSNVRSVEYDTTAPGTAGAPLALSPTRVKPVVTFTAASDAGSGIAAYRVYRDGALAGTTATTSFTDATAPANNSYGYTVAAVDAAGNVGATNGSVSVTYDALAPTVPGNLAAATPTAAKPALTWTASSDAMTGIAGYEIYRGPTLVGTTTALAFTDTALTAAGSQSYTVKAIDGAGNASAATPAKVVVYDNVAPGAPGKPTIPTPSAAPALQWAAATDVGGSNIARYDVYRDAVLIGTATGTSYTDSAVSADGAYAYTVRAADGAGNTGPLSPATSVTVDRTAPGAPGTVSGPTPTTAKPALAWVPATDNAGGVGVSLYRIYRGPVLAGTSTGTTFSDTTVTVNGQYSYTVRAVDGAGNEGPPTPGYDVIWDSSPPPTPTGLSAVSPTMLPPALSWVSGGAASDFDHYDIFRGGVRIGGTTGTTFTDTTLVASGAYTYTVKAIDLLGNASAASSPRVVAYDLTAPGAVPSLSVGTPTNRPYLTWVAASDTGGSQVAGYRIYRDGVAIDSTTALNYTDASLSVEGLYAYVVRAYDAAGNEGGASPTRTVLFDDEPPPAPTGLAAPSPTASPALTWTTASDSSTGDSGVPFYRVYRGGVPIATVNGATAYADTASFGDGSYSYSVAAIDGAGNEGPRSSSLLLLVDRTPPPTPTGLTGPAVSSARPALTWASGGADALSGFDHYEILRNGAVVGTSVTEAFTDSALAANGTYAYAVRSMDAAGNRSPASVQRSATWDDTPPAIPAAPNATSPTNRPALSWLPAVDTGGAGGVVYTVLRDGAPAGTTAATSFIDTDVLADGTYSYRVVASDAAANASAPSTALAVAVDTTPPPSVGLPAASSPTSRPQLSWAPVVDASAIARYDVYRGGTLAGSTPTTTFTDLAVALDGSYAYSVVAVDGAGNAAPGSPPLAVLFDRTPPPTPSQPAALSPTDAKPALTWTSGGADALSGFDHYAVYRDGALVGSPTGPSFADADLTALGPHVYTVRAVDAAGNLSAPSAPRSVIYDTLAPPLPTDLLLPSPTRTPQLTWTAVSDDATGGAGVTGYRVFRDGAALAIAPSPSYVDGSLTVSGSHAYWVTAVDAVGNESAPSATRIVYVDVEPPPPPPDVAAASPSSRPVLTWTASSDDATGGTGITGYNVYRQGSLLGRTSATSWVDGNVPDSGRYSYTVRAVDGAGNVGAPSAAVTVDVDVAGPELTNLSVPRRRTVGDDVVFSVNAADREGSAVGAPVWNFGDGTAQGLTVTHRFTVPGVYRIAVTVADVLGNATVSPPATIEIVPRLSLAKLEKPKVQLLRDLRYRGWQARAVVRLNQPATVTVLMYAGNTAVAAVTRNVPDGSTPIFIRIPPKWRKPRTFSLKLTVKDSRLTSTTTLVVRKRR